MKQTFDYLELVDFVATVCDKDGIVIYQNAASLKRKGNVMGTSVFNCHKPSSNEKIRHMLESGENYTYAIVKNGKKVFIRQSPWYERKGGPVAGLIELFIPVPDEYPTFDRDKK